MISLSLGVSPFHADGVWFVTIP